MWQSKEIEHNTLHFRHEKCEGLLSKYVYQKKPEKLEISIKPYFFLINMHQEGKDEVSIVL